MKVKYKGIVDDNFVEVKVLQTRKRKNQAGEDISRVEITRDLKGKAGFWVDIKELKYEN